MLLLGLLVGVVRFSLFRAQDATSEENVHRVIIVDFLLRSERTHYARCQFSPDKVTGKLHIRTLHDSVELI